MGAVGATANNEVLQYKPAGVPSTPSWEKVVKVHHRTPLISNPNQLLGLYAFGMADNYLENFEHQIVGFPMGTDPSPCFFPHCFQDMVRLKES